jgi:hypothetical protein
MMTISTAEDFKQPILQFDDETGLWRLMVPYSFEWTDPKLKRREKLSFAAGGKYDKASVPRPLWGVARPDGPWEGPSYLHDNAFEYLKNGGSFPPGMYQVQQADGSWIDGPRRNQYWANWLLAYSAECTKVISKWEANEYRLAVTLYPINWFKGF